MEWICRDCIRLYCPEVLRRAAREVGQIWRANYDIDVAGRLLDGTFIWGECKWWGAVVRIQVLDHLQKATLDNSYYAGRKDDLHDLLFSRS